jgi:hypothetical protein
MDIQTVADQPRRNAVEHAPQHEAAARRDLDPCLLVISRLSFGKWLEQRALDLDVLAVASIAPADHLALWLALDRDSFNWHSVAVLATWFMTLVIQRAEHRDTQALMPS